MIKTVVKEIFISTDLQQFALCYKHDNGIMAQYIITDDWVVILWQFDQYQECLASG